MSMQMCFTVKPIEKVADEFIEESQITSGNFDNEEACKYLVPELLEYRRSI